MFDGYDPESMLRSLNMHMPKKRLLLTELLDSADPHYVTKDGKDVPISRQELQDLADVCEPAEVIRLRVPIYVSTDTSSATGAWKVEGKLEAAVVSRMLGRDRLREDLVVFYHPHLRELRRRFPSCFNILYTP